MRKLDAPVIDPRFAKDDILLSYQIGLGSIRHPVEPHQVADGRPVREMGHEPFLPRRQFVALKTKDMAFDLDEGHVAREFGDAIDLRPIDILIRKILQQVTIGSHTQFVVEQVLATRPNPGEVHDVLFE